MLQEVRGDAKYLTREVPKERAWVSESAQKQGEACKHPDRPLVSEVHARAAATVVANFSVNEEHVHSKKYES